MNKVETQSFSTVTMQFQQANLVKKVELTSFQWSLYFLKLNSSIVRQVIEIGKFIYTHILCQRWLIILIPILFLTEADNIYLMHIGIQLTAVVLYIITLLLRILFLKQVRKDDKNIKIFKKLRIKKQSFFDYFYYLITGADKQIKQQQSNQSKWLYQNTFATDLRIGDIVILQRNQYSPLDLLIIDVSQDAAGKDFQNLEQRESEILVAPSLTTLSRKIENAQKLNTQFRKILNGFIKIERLNNNNYKGFIKLKKDPKGEEISNSSFLLEGCKFVQSEWGIGIVIKQKSKLQYYKDLFNKSDQIAKINFFILKIFVIELAILFFIAILYQKNFGSNYIFIKDFSSKLAHMNFYLLNTYTIHDLYAVCYLIRKLYSGTLGGNYFVESQNNSKITANKIMISPQILRHHKYYNVTSIVTKSENVLIDQRSTKQFADNIKQLIERFNVNNINRKQKAVAEEDIKADVFTEQSAKVISYDEDSQTSEFRFQSSFNKQFYEQYFFLIQAMLLTNNLYNFVNSENKLQRSNLRSVQNVISQFLRQISCENIIKYELRNFENKIQCLKMGRKLFKFGLVKRALTKYGSSVYVQDLQSNTKDNLIYFVREEVEKLPDYYSMSANERERINKTIKKIIKKGEIPVVFGMKKTNSVIQNTNECNFCGLLSIACKVNPQSQNILEVLQRKQIQPIFVCDSPLFQMAGTLKRLKIFKKKLIFTLRQGDIVSLKAQMLEFLRKFEKKNFDKSLKSSTYQLDYEQMTWTKQIVFIFSGQSFQIIQQSKNEVVKYFLCLLTFAQKIVVYDINSQGKRKLVRLLQNNDQNKILGILNNKSDLYAYQNTQFKFTMKRQIYNNIFCRSLEGFREALEQLTQQNLVPFDRSFIIYMHLWVSWLIYLTVYGFFLINSLSALLMGQYFIQTYLYNVLYVLLIILGLLFKWTPEMPNIYLTVILFLTYTVMYATKFHLIQSYILEVYIILPIYMFKQYKAQFGLFALTIIIQCIYMALIQKSLVKVDVGSDLYQVFIILIFTGIIRYIYDIYFRRYRYQDLMYSTSLLADKQTEIVQNVDSMKKANLRNEITEFLKINGYDLAISQIFNLNILIDSIPLRCSNYFQRFLNADVENQYQYQRTRREITRLIIQYFLSVLVMEFFFIIYFDSYGLLIICIIAEIYCIVYFYISQYNKTWIYVFYVFKLMSKIYVDYIYSAESSIGIVFLMFTVQDFIIIDQFKIVLNLIQILSINFNGIVVNNMIVTIILLAFVVCTTLYYYNLEKIRRARFSYELCFKNQSQLKNQLLKLMLPPIVQRSYKEKFQTFIENKIIFSCSISNFVFLLDAQRESAIKLLDRLWKQIDNLVIQNKLQKVQTFSSSYLAVGNCLENTIVLAYEVLNFIQQSNSFKFNIKIAINKGPVECMVVSRNRPQLLYVGQIITETFSVCKLGQIKAISITEKVYQSISSNQSYKFSENRGQLNKSQFIFYTLKINESRKINDNLVRLPQSLERNFQCLPGEKYVEIKVAQELSEFANLNQIQEFIDSKNSANLISESNDIAEFFSLNNSLLCSCVVLNGLWLILILLGQQIDYNLNIIIICRTLNILTTLVYMYIFTLKKKFLFRSNDTIKILVEIVIVFLSILQVLIIGEAKVVSFLKNIQNIVFITTMLSLFYFTEQSKVLFSLILSGAALMYIPLITVQQGSFYFYLIISLIIIIVAIPDLKFIKLSFIKFFNQEKKKRKELNEITEQLLPAHVLNLFVSNPNKKIELIETLQDATVMLISYVGIDQFLNEAKGIEAANCIRKITEQLDQLCNSIKIFKLSSFNNFYLAFGVKDNTNRAAELEARNTIEVALTIFERIQAIKKSFNIDRKINLKIAINTGLVYGAIVGAQIVKYDIFGTTVEMLYKMIQKCETGQVIISQSTKQKIESSNSYCFKQKSNPINKSEQPNLQYYYLSRF